MNDFTKEELQQISFCLYAYPHKDDDHIYEPLRTKIQSIIDNDYENISYYHCGKCTESMCLIIKCPICGHEGHENE